MCPRPVRSKSYYAHKGGSLLQTTLPNSLGTVLPPAKNCSQLVTRRVETTREGLYSVAKITLSAVCEPDPASRPVALVSGSKEIVAAGPGLERYSAGER